MRAPGVHEVMKIIGAELALVLSLAASGCSSGGGAGNGAAPSTTGDSGAENADGYRELVAQDWTAEPGVEAYYCTYQTLTEDIVVNSFRPLMPDGTHHVVIGYQ